MSSQNWVMEFRPDNRGNMYRILKTDVSTRSAYQEILIADVMGFGRVLFLDSIPQSSAVDEHIYHEVLLHPALVAHPNPRTVFIAGGGEGAVLREALKHDTVEKIVMVDIDKELIDLSREYLQDWHQGLYDDPRVQLIHGDARAYLEGSQEKFDCIFLDLTDPLEGGASTPLFTVEFFQLACSCLSPDGTFAMQAGATDLTEHRDFVSIVKTLQQSFKVVLPYQVFIPIFGLPWGFAMASKQDIHARFSPENITKTLQERHCSDLKFYDAETHLYLFSLPKYLRDALGNPDVGTISRDSQPVLYMTSSGEKGTK